MTVTKSHKSEHVAKSISGDNDDSHANGMENNLAAMLNDQEATNKAEVLCRVIQKLVWDH
eukprot:TRINITY_DN999_c0_g1_i1.p1 TRINITY_DN999_c0_g1~~TRINITY_DN999_c0_g1_i1.p1  ORF type:complete len:60 (+),score=12.28 TRINITY_DN999_c0_g1_i1:707-886(+)